MRVTCVGTLTGKPSGLTVNPVIGDGGGASGPNTVTMIDEPGALRTSTNNSFCCWSVTGVSMISTFLLNSLGVTTRSPFKVITALLARPRLPSPFCTTITYSALWSCTEKVVTTFSGVSESRTYSSGPKTGVFPNAWQTLNSSVDASSIDRQIFFITETSSERPRDLVCLRNRYFRRVMREHCPTQTTNAKKPDALCDRYKGRPRQSGFPGSQDP